MAKVIQCVHCSDPTRAQLKLIAKTLKPMRMLSFNYAEERDRVLSAQFYDFFFCSRVTVENLTCHFSAYYSLAIH